MNKMKKCNKGFTLTELAIVIAVIAILIAVLVPTFISLVNKAEESSDKQLVKNLNTSLSTHTSVVTPADALDAVEEDGYSVEKLKTESDSEIIYDAATTSFVLLTEGKVSYPSGHSIDLSASTTWYLVSSQSEITSPTASYIVTGTWSTSSASANTVQAAKLSIKKAASAPTGATVSYSGEGGIDTSRATGIATVNYTYTGTATEATVTLNVTSGSLYVKVESTTGTVTINNYSSEEVTTAVTGTSDSATVKLNNVNGSACYVETTISSKVTYTGDSESYTVVESVNISTGTVEVGSEDYPYLLASEEDLTNKISYGGYYLVTQTFTSTTAVTIAANSEVILNLGGNELTISGTTTAFNTNLANIVNKGSLTIIDGTESGAINVSTALIGVYNAGELNLQGGTIVGEYLYSYTKDDGTTGTTGNSYTVFNSGEIALNGGNIESNHHGIYNSAGSVAINEGTINSTTYGIYGDSGFVIINGGTISATYGIANFDILYVNGGSIYGSNRAIQNTGTTTITGGNIGQVTISDSKYISYYGIIDFGGTLTIGSSNANNSEINIVAEYMALYLSTGTVCDLYSGTITASYGIGCWGFSSDAYTILSIFGGVVTGTDGFAVCGNGTTGQGYDKIYIYGGTLTSTDAQAIYNPQQQGETYIYGGTISGTSGIEIRNGYVYIGEVEGKTTDSLYIKATYNPSDTESNNNGSTTAGAAIAISAYNLVDINVEIGRGTYEGFYSFYEYYVNGDYDKDGNKLETPNKVTVNITINVTDGTFKGTVYSQNVTGFISGGSYTVNTNLSSYLADGYKVTQDGNYYIVSEGTVAEETND